MGLAHDDELGRHHLGALVKLLEKGVLTVRANLAENDRTGHAVNRLAITGDALAVGFHLQLLEIGGQATQYIGIGRD